MVPNKGHVAKKNVAANVTSVKELILEKVNMIGPDEWKKVCDHAIKCEDEYRKFEPVFDNHSDRFILNIGSSSDSNDSESEMSGIEVISNSD